MTDGAKSDVSRENDGWGGLGDSLLTKICIAMSC